ncbi:hypothetical protein M8C21_009297, partial [Ambrosia artemisiifolia]
QPPIGCGVWVQMKVSTVAARVPLRHLVVAVLNSSSNNFDKDIFSTGYGQASMNQSRVVCLMSVWIRDPQATLDRDLHILKIKPSRPVQASYGVGH